MTVRELIKELEKYPKETTVIDMSFMKVEDVIFVKDWPKGDPANPKCEYEPAVMIS